MKSRLLDNINNLEGNYIFPFFWQAGADHDTLRNELKKIYECRLKSLCVESRPHPDFGGPQWWSDMDLIMDFAREHEMTVWLLDDDRFPTGHANKAFSDGNNPLSARFLTVHNTDVKGPLSPGYVLLKKLLSDDNELVGVAACRRKSGDTTDLDITTAQDVTHCVQNGWLKWDVPEGLWRILVFYTTRHGNGKLDYFNILDSASVRVLLDQVYEPHYERYKEDFGKTFLGFFSDEPEFSNLPGYDFQARLGKNMPFIPWSKELWQKLEKRWGEDFLKDLGALWYDVGEMTPHLRYEYMDEVTKQLAVSFSGQIGDWCRERNVDHIGHIIEDDNSHGRLGCSTGHYFRSIGSMGMAGIDVVLLQIMPEMDQGEHQWVASSRDGEFFHYGLGKMGSSLAHIDAKKKGDSMCEIFGAFGWQEGVGLMKWLTDHMISRGINHFVPHAFSMKPYPDPDCPPHFYAHGKNPQFAHFGYLMGYMNRLSHLFTDGTFPARIAVLYHPDSEWAGEAMLFQKPVRVMLENQLDCDIIPADLLKENNIYGAVFEDGICVADQKYELLIIPGCEYLPLDAAKFILNHKMPTVFVDQLPRGICENTLGEAEIVEQLRTCSVVPLEELGAYVKDRCKSFLVTDSYYPGLRTYPYIHKYETCYIFCFNESLRDTLEFELSIQYGDKNSNPFRYNAAKNICSAVQHTCYEDHVSVSLSLEPCEAAVLVIGNDSAPELKKDHHHYHREQQLDGIWELSYKDVNEEDWHALDLSCDTDGFPDLTEWAVLHEFCGSVRYKTTVNISEQDAGNYVLHLFGNIDCADVRVNGQLEERLIGIPGYADLSLKAGKNEIEVELPFTPVWRDGDIWSSLTVIPQMGLTKKPVLMGE